jgi:hypothetical protein
VTVAVAMLNGTDRSGPHSSQVMRRRKADNTPLLGLVYAWVSLETTDADLREGRKSAVLWFLEPSTSREVRTAPVSPGADVTGFCDGIVAASRFRSASVGFQDPW